MSRSDDDPRRRGVRGAPEHDAIAALPMHAAGGADATDDALSDAEKPSYLGQED